jgi:hypothetical protein
MGNIVIFILLLLALPPAGPLAGQRSSGPQAEAQVQKLWAEFEKTAWSAPQADWSNLHPEVSCQRFRGYGSGSADGQWCHRCAEKSQPQRARWSFYIFSLQEPLVCRLGHFDASTDSLPGDTLKQVRQLLQERLAARYGPGEDRSGPIARARAVPWPEYVRWRAGDVEIRLNLSEFDSKRKEGRLSVVARHRALLDALAEDGRLNHADSRGSLYQVGSPLDVHLAGELRADFPDIATMLMQQQPTPDPEKVREAIQQHLQQLRNQGNSGTGQNGVRAGILAVPTPNWKPEEFHDALVRLLKTSTTSLAERQPVFLLAADRLAMRKPGLIATDESQPRWAEWRRELAGYSMTFKQSETGAEQNPWTYSHDLLRRVWKDYSDSDWGERAFLLLQSLGWDTSPDCEAGNDQFRAVIPRGQQFLEQRPKSPYLLDVQLAMAQAYETWWSLSQAPTGEEYSDVKPAKYQKGASTARQKSIAYYEQLVQTAPQSDHAAYARRELPRLSWV